MRGLLCCCLLVVACSESGEDSSSATGAGMGGSAGTGGTLAGAAGVSGDGGGPELGPPPAGDTCADAVDVDAVATAVADGVLVVSATNVNGRTDLEVCDTSTSPVADVVYRYTVPATGGLHWWLESVTPTRFVADVRSTCDDPTSNLACDDCYGTCGTDLEVTAGDTLFFVISGVRTTNSSEGAGEFELGLRLSPDPALGESCMSPYAGGRACPEGSVCQAQPDEEPICGAPSCGDGYLSFDPLQCDDGNSMPDDGCSDSCEIDMQGPGGATCAEPATLNLPPVRGILSGELWHMAYGTGDFVAGDDEVASCATADGPEAIYVFEIDRPYQVEITAQNAEVLSVRRAGASDCGTDELKCVSGTADSALALTFPSLDPGRYAILLDRENPTSATSDTYNVDVVVSVPSPQ